MADRQAWIEEGAHPVVPGVHRIPLPLPSDGLRAVNVYAIEAEAGLVLIDSGWALANALEQLERSLAVIGAGLPDVRRFLVTHMHRDHYTQAVEIRRLLGTTIALGAGEQPSIDGLLSGEFRPMRAQLAVLRLAALTPWRTAWRKRPVAASAPAGRRARTVPRKPSCQLVIRRCDPAPLSPPRSATRHPTPGYRPISNSTLAPGR